MGNKKKDGYTAGAALHTIMGTKEQMDEQLHLRVSASMKEAIQQAADDHEMTVIAYIRMVMRANLKQNGYL